MQFTLDGMEGTTFTAIDSGKSVAVAVGNQAAPSGTMTVTAQPPLYGEHVKTFMLNADRTHDFCDQQGATFTLDVTPGSAAITAIHGEQRVALHGSGRALAAEQKPHGGRRQSADGDAQPPGAAHPVVVLTAQAWPPLGARWSA